MNEILLQALLKKNKDGQMTIEQVPILTRQVLAAMEVMTNEVPSVWMT